MTAYYKKKPELPPDKDSTEYKMCYKKRSYPKNKAKFLAHKAATKTKEPIEAYKCRFGKHWHMGHKKTDRRGLPSSDDPIAAKSNNMNDNIQVI